MHRSVLAGAVVVLALACAPARADIYAFTDDAGVTHFSNVPVDARYQLLIESIVESAESGEEFNPVMLAGSVAYDPIIEHAARSMAIEPALLRAVIVVESGFNARAVSKRGARGLMQLMPATAERYGVSDAFDPAQNVAAGARYLRDLINRYENDLELALAAYNAGETAVERHGRSVPPYKETRQYVPRVLRIYQNLLALTRRG